MADPKRKTLFVIIAVAVLAVAGCAWYFYKVINNDPKADANITVSTPVETPEQTSPVTKTEFEVQINDTKQAISSVDDDLSKLDKSSETSDTAPSL